MEPWRLVCSQAESQSGDPAVQEEEARDKAALGSSTGGLVALARMLPDGSGKLQLVKEERENDAAARRLQVWWSRMNGSYAAKLKARAEIQLFKEEEARDKAAPDRTGGLVALARMPR